MSSEFLIRSIDSCELTEDRGSFRLHYQNAMINFPQTNLGRLN